MWSREVTETRWRNVNSNTFWNILSNSFCLSDEPFGHYIFNILKVVVSSQDLHIWRTVIHLLCCTESFIFQQQQFVWNKKNQKPKCHQQKMRRKDVTQSDFFWCAVQKNHSEIKSKLNIKLQNLCQIVRLPKLMCSHCSF